VSMSQNDFWNELERRTAKYDLLSHPFYKAWTAGELTRQDLREYARDYYHHVAAFPEYLGALAARLPEGALRSAVLENRDDELGMDSTGRRSHDAIWLEFARAMGADPAEVGASRPLPEVRELIESFDSVARSGSPAEALAAFYAYESQVPRVAAEKASGLRDRYGADDAACEYFTLHATADVYHSRVWREQLDRLISEEPDQAALALGAAENAAHALWRALDGIEARRQAVFS
jgi:pyrroloquinoline-quinone synthase